MNGELLCKCKNFQLSPNYKKLQNLKEFSSLSPNFNAVPNETKGRALIVILLD